MPKGPAGVAEVHEAVFIGNAQLGSETGRAACGDGVGHGVLFKFEIHKEFL